jgi:aryl-alcohol dehydrogenase-like predicted oxidoreductase
LEYRILGRTGVSVSELCLGTEMFGAWGNQDHQDCIRIIHRGVDEGINLIDTADIYSSGESEEIVGKALAGGLRQRVLLASKVGLPMGHGPNSSGNSRLWIVEAIERSLRRLKTDWIDLYQLHRPDPRTPIDETMAALTDLVHAGKIRYFGTSTFPAEEIVEAQWMAERHGCKRPVCEQAPYSMLARGIEVGVLPTCEKHRVGVMVWSPLTGGWLSGQYRKGRAIPVSPRASRKRERYDLSLEGNVRKLEAADALGRLAHEAGLSLIHLALRFVLQPGTVTAALIGPETMDHLEAQLGVNGAPLDESLLGEIDRIVPPGTNLNPADAGWDPIGRRHLS